MNKINNIGYIDEVGRGCLFGDLYICCVVNLKKDIKHLTDSKLLSSKQREQLFNQIIQNIDCYGLGIVTPQEIDTIGIVQAVELGIIRAINNCVIKPDFIYIDGLDQYNNIPIPYETVIKGDLKIKGISAASIIAKVLRDRQMEQMKEFEKYHIPKNKGYGTKQHIEAIKQYGPTSFHRQSFLKFLLKEKK